MAMRDNHFLMSTFIFIIGLQLCITSFLNNLLIVFSVNHKSFGLYTVRQLLRAHGEILTLLHSF